MLTPCIHFVKLYVLEKVLASIRLAFLHLSMSKFLSDLGESKGPFIIYGRGEDG